MFNIYRCSKYLVSFKPIKIIRRHKSLEIKLMEIDVHYNAKHMSISEWDEKLIEPMKINKEETLKGVLKFCHERQNLDLATSFLVYINKAHEMQLPFAKAHHLNLLTSDIKSKESYIKLCNEITTPKEIESPSFDGIVETNLKDFLAAIQFYEKDKIVDLALKHTDTIISMIENEHNPIRTQAAIKILVQSYSYKRAPLQNDVFCRIAKYLRNNKIKFKVYELSNSERDCNYGDSLITPVKTSQANLAILKNAVENVVIKDKTAHTEWKLFKHFLTLHGKFDVVVDGMNFTHGVQLTENPQLLQEMRKLGSKFLFIGRSWVNKTIRDFALSLNQSYEVFYPAKNHDDDLFAIYAALWSGTDAKFISNDRMRDHSTLKINNTSLKGIFENWQKCHQFFVTHKKGWNIRCSIYDQLAHYDGQNILHLTSGSQSKWICLELDEF